MTSVAKGRYKNRSWVVRGTLGRANPGWLGRDRKASDRACGLLRVRMWRRPATLTMAASSMIGELRDSINDVSARIQQKFEAEGDGRAAVAQRTALVEEILAKLFHEFFSREEGRPANISLVATGGFGRGWLFPYSDIDVLFLFSDRDAEQAFKDPVRRFSQELWDLRLKLSPASRTLAECDRYDANNTEFTISLLDSPLSCRGSRLVPALA